MNTLALALAALVALAAPAAYLVNASPADPAMPTEPAPDVESGDGAQDVQAGHGPGTLLVSIVHEGLPDASRVEITDGTKSYVFLGPFADGEVHYKFIGVHAGTWRATLTGPTYSGSSSIDLADCPTRGGELRFATHFDLSGMGIMVEKARCLE